MKFGYRDRIILLIACVIIIFCIGIFLFIKPKWEALDKNQKALDTKQNEWSQTLESFKSIPGRQKTILSKYEKGKEIAAEFTPEMNSVELDKFLQEKFMNTDIHVAHNVRAKGAVSVTDQGTSSISYYYYTPNFVTYPLFEAADMDGSLAKAIAEKRKESDILSNRAAQTVGSGKSSLTIHTDRKDLMELLKAVHEYAVKNKDAMIINSVNIADYTFGLLPGEIVEFPEEITKDADGKIELSEVTIKESEATVKSDNPTDTSANTTKKERAASADPGYTDVTIQYDVYYMQEPMKPYVGPEYNESIWDGDEWRNYTAAEKAS